MDTIDKFFDWNDSYSTHQNRFLQVARMHSKNLQEYVELFSKYPANSEEFKAEVIRLYAELSEIVEQLSENMDDLRSDYSSIIDILEEMKEMDWK